MWASRGRTGSRGILGSPANETVCILQRHCGRERGPLYYGHLVWTMAAPSLRYSCLESHILRCETGDTTAGAHCWKVPSEARMDPPIQGPLRRSMPRGDVRTRTFSVCAGEGGPQRGAHVVEAVGQLAFQPLLEALHHCGAPRHDDVVHDVALRG